jgi:hypothetical protein
MAETNLLDGIAVHERWLLAFQLLLVRPKVLFFRLQPRLSSLQFLFLLVALFGCLRYPLLSRFDLGYSAFV